METHFSVFGSCQARHTDATEPEIRAFYQSCRVESQQNSSADARVLDSDQDASRPKVSMSQQFGPLAVVFRGRGTLVACCLCVPDHQKRGEIPKSACHPVPAFSFQVPLIPFYVSYSLFSPSGCFLRHLCSCSRPSFVDVL